MNRLNNNIRIVTFAAWAAAVVACTSVVSSCSTKEDLDSRGVIRLGASASAPASRAAINNLTDLSRFGGDKVGLFGLETEHSTPVVGGWSGNLVMKNVRTSAVDTDGTLHWAGTYYYPLESTRYVEFFAYHPFAEIADAGSGENNYVEFYGTDAAPVLHFTLDGSQDVMYAAPVVGSIQSKPEALEFRHALTRLTFALNDPDGAYAGATLNGITFQQVDTKGSLNIENGALGEWSAPQDLAMPMTPVAIVAKDQLQTVDADMMLRPGQSSFLITVHTSYGDVPNVKITPKTNADGSKAETFAAEHSYRITLKFDTMKEIESSAKVEEWVFGGYGYGVVQ
ncbi:MAG: fimbrillin family protein [Alistipes senegalensis]|nr:fimbrillin family protein [Bacteroides cellulosilyticus]MCM1353047.1 fimbrillin family protein [Alistipes senegalensis]